MRQALETADHLRNLRENLGRRGRGSRRVAPRAGAPAPLRRLREVRRRARLARGLLLLLPVELGDGGAVSLAGALGENSRLASLRLSWNKMGDGGAGALGAALGRTNRTLTALDISRKDVSPAAAAALAKAVEANAALSAGLELYGSRHRDEFVVVSGAASPA